MNSPQADIQDLLNAQTGKVGWQELTRHFARGVVICVRQDQDLVSIANCLVNDKAIEIKILYAEGIIHRALDEDAQRWEENKTRFWAVVVAPWVLVQEAK
jgi:hypothetical protein